MPTTFDGDSSGSNHTYGVLTLEVTGTVGETFTFSDTVDTTNVPGGLTHTVVGLDAVTVASVPEPGAWFLLLSGVAVLFAFRRLHRFEV